jgi:hypothetical protein
VVRRLSRGRDDDARHRGHDESLHLSPLVLVSLP